MRSHFLERFVDLAVEAGLGVAVGCLQDVTALVDRVIASHHQDLQETDHFVAVLSDFEELTRRMIQDARDKGYPELHEDTLFAAREKCGLIYWCSE